MSAMPVKGPVARRILPPVPTALEYPATRQALVSLPSRIARDTSMQLTHLRVLLELASAGADTQWIMLPSLKFLSETIHLHPAPISRAIHALAEAHYIEIKQVNRITRYARITIPGYTLDWE